MSAKVYWEDDPTRERNIVGRCGRCERTLIFIFDPKWHGWILSPKGVMHIGVDGGKTACGIDATGDEWWWPS